MPPVAVSRGNGVPKFGSMVAAAVAFAKSSPSLANTFITSFLAAGAAAFFCRATVFVMIFAVLLRTPDRHNDVAGIALPKMFPNNSVVLWERDGRIRTGERERERTSLKPSYFTAFRGHPNATGR